MFFTASLWDGPYKPWGTSHEPRATSHEPLLTINSKKRGIPMDKEHVFFENYAKNWDRDRKADDRVL